MIQNYVIAKMQICLSYGWIILLEIYILVGEAEPSFKP